jgi:hypothetical protein
VPIVIGFASCPQSKQWAKGFFSNRRQLEMMKGFIFRFIYSLLFVFMVMSCGQKQDSPINDAEIKLNVKNFDENQLIPSEIIKSISFIPLETNEKNLFTGIGKIYKHNDYFIIQDNSFALGILVFDKTGKFVNNIGKYGKGPREIIDFTDFTIDEDEKTIMILDQRQHKVVYYGLEDFSFIKETGFDKGIFTQGFASVGKGRLSLYSIRQTNRDKQYNIVNLNMEDNSWSGSLERSDYEINSSYRHAIFESKNSYFAPYFENTVYKLSENGPVPYIVMDFGNRAFPREDVKGESPKLILKKLIEGAWIYGTNNVIENESLLTFNIKIANRMNQIIYSKATGKYYYGNEYDNDYGILLRPENLAADEKNFYGIVEGFVFRRMKKRVLELPDGLLKEAYLKAMKNVDTYSNPIIVAIEYKSF